MSDNRLDEAGYTRGPISDGGMDPRNELERNNEIVVYPLSVLQRRLNDAQRTLDHWIEINERVDSPHTWDKLTEASRKVKELGRLIKLKQEAK